MNYLDKYSRRIGRKGKNVGEGFHNSTLDFIDSTFHQSPTYRVLEVVGSEFPDITEIDARILQIERMGNLREILFRPRQGLNIGAYVKFDGDIWLAFDKYGSSDSANLKLLVQKCNRVLKWKNLDETITSFDCVASASPLGSKSNQGKSDIEWNKFDVRLPIGQLFVFVESNDKTKNIRMNQRFIIGDNVYEVFGIDSTTLVDKNSFGVIQLTVKVTTKHNSDDFINGVAFNRYEDFKEPPIDEGGRIW